MKIYLSADIEGITGSIHWNEGSADQPEYRYFQEQMTKEVAAACEGALAAGADEVLVKDAHYTARNIIPDMLPEKTKLLRGWTEAPEMMVAGIDEGYDGAVFIGYHAAAGSNASPLSHTMNPKLQSVTCNGEPLSEFDINAMTAAYYKVPVLFVSGDAGLCKAAKAAYPGIHTVAVNEGLGGGAVCLHPHTAIVKIREAVENAVKGYKKAGLCPMPERFRIEICYKEHAMAAKALNYPGIAHKDDTTVVYEADDYMDVMKMFFWLL
ncbi:MAG: M55 family metallopeptidase [Clostridiales bacterium]|nr:M55 family metallopeptidase [Clostridiales bacterium]